MKPATAAALELVRQGLTAYEAWKRTGVAQSTIHRALARKVRPCCPACGQAIRSKPKPAIKRDIAPDVQKAMVAAVAPSRISPPVDPA